MTGSLKPFKEDQMSECLCVPLWKKLSQNFLKEIVHCIALMRRRPLLLPPLLLCVASLSSLLLPFLLKRFPLPVSTVPQREHLCLVLSISHYFPFRHSCSDDFLTTNQESLSCSLCPAQRITNSTLYTRKEPSLSLSLCPLLTCF